MNSGLDVGVPNAMPPDPHNMIVACIVLVFLGWMLKLCKDALNLQDLRVARQQGRLLYVDGVAAHLGTVSALSRPHLAQFLRTQRHVPASKVPRLKLPFHVVSQPQNVLSERPPNTVRPSQLAVSVDVESQAPVFVQAYWGVLGSAVTRLRAKGLRGGGKAGVAARKAARTSRRSAPLAVPGAAQTESGNSLADRLPSGRSRRGYTGVEDGDSDEEAAGVRVSSLDLFARGSYLYRTDVDIHALGGNFTYTVVAPPEAVRTAMQEEVVQEEDDPSYGQQAKSRIVPNQGAETGDDSMIEAQPPDLEAGDGGPAGAGVDKAGASSGAAAAAAKSVPGGDGTDAELIPLPFPLNVYDKPDRPEVEAERRLRGRRRKVKPARFALAIVLGRYAATGDAVEDKGGDMRRRGRGRLAASAEPPEIEYHVTLVDAVPGVAATGTSAHADDEKGSGGGDGGSVGAGGKGGTSELVGKGGPDRNSPPEWDTPEWAGLDEASMTPEQRVERAQGLVCATMKFNVASTLVVTRTGGYELTELFGVEEDDDDMDCLVCMTEKKSVVLLPCRHLCVCADCFTHIDKCPVCRTVYDSYMVFQWKESAADGPSKEA